MRGAVWRWGEEMGVTLPEALLAEAGIALGQVVEARVEDGRIVIAPVRPRLYDLDALLSGVTDENLHGEIDFGPPVGREVW